MAGTGLYTVLDSPVVRERIDDTVRPALATAATAVPVVEEPPGRHTHGYYVDAALQITAQADTGTVELGDGGFTTWTAQLTGNAKERCLVSCLSTERLVTLTVPPARP